MSITIAQAIQSLKPGAEFSYQNEDYATIQWNVLEGAAPTAKQIADEIKRLEAEVLQQENAKTAAKQSAMDKLTALGLTADEVVALIP